MCAENQMLSKTLSNREIIRNYDPGDLLSAYTVVAFFLSRALPFRTFGLDFVVFFFFWCVERPFGCCARRHILLASRTS